MKALFINGSPRKNWSTFKMLESAMKGVSDAGAEVELYNLYETPFKGCVSCFACKLKNSKTNGLCAYKDALTPVLEKAQEADVIVIGSPIYFSHPTGLTHAFMERLMFPLLSYNPKIDEESGEYKMTLLNRTVPTAMIYTMGVSKELFDAQHYPELLGEDGKFLKQIYGYTETLYSHDTYQFSDYSRYDVLEGTEVRRAKQRDEQFPKDLEQAYELGKRLAEKAKEL